jgi:hypothetical protein
LFIKNTITQMWIEVNSAKNNILKLVLTAPNIYVVTVYRAPSGNFNSFLNGLNSIIKSLYKVELKLIIWVDINIDYLTVNERENT